MSPPKHTTHSSASLRAPQFFALFYLFITCLSSAVDCVEIIDDELDLLQKNWTAIQISCRDPGRIKHGQRSPEFKQGQLFQYQQELHFQCNIGYRLLQGVEKLVCGPDGQWLPLPRQRCRPVLCPRPTLLHGHVLVPGTDFRTLTNLEVQCNEGFRLQNKFVNRLECKMDGTWTGHNGAFTEELPECVEFTCPPLPEMPNSIIEYKGTRGWDHGFKDGATAKYVCRQGFKNVAVIGSDESKCHNGTWTGRTLIFCDILSCNPPPIVPNAIVKVINSDQDEDALSVNYPVGVSVIYWCISGFALMGSSARFKCMHDGHWSPPQIPTCQEINEEQSKKCSAPPAITFGYVKDALDEYTPFSEVAYACHEGFHLLGPEQLTCSVDGQWQPDPPVCELILDKEEFDWDGFREIPPAQEKPRVQELPQQAWDAMGAQTVSFLTAGCVMGILFLVLISAMIAQRHGCGKWCHVQLRPSVSGGSSSGALHGPPLCQDQDRASLIAFADGVQVALPSYEEATSNQFPSDFIYNGSLLLPRSGAFSSNRHNRYVLHRSSGTHDHNNGNAGGPGRQPGSTCGRSSSLADSLGSTDTVTPSEVSTTVTVDTLSSTLSQATSSTNSTRAFCGSLTSFDTAGSGSVLNIEGVPLIEESENEKLLSSTEMQAQQQAEEAT